jgi:hypothetical protein
VLLLRGDPTIPVDAVVEEIDLAEALPVAPAGNRSAWVHHVALGHPDIAAKERA